VLLVQKSGIDLTSQDKSRLGSAERDLLLREAYFWMKNIFDAPLQRRGWVCQDRFLPPRTLNFGATQLFWERGESSLCEQFPLRMPSQVSAGGLSGIIPHIHGAEMRRNRNMAADSSLDAFNIWSMVVGRYTSGALTQSAQ
jgi:hypothetical protein